MAKAAGLARHLAGAVAWCLPFVIAPFWLVDHTLWRTDRHGWWSWGLTAIWPILALGSLGAATAHVMGERPERAQAPDIDTPGITKLAR